MQLVICRRVSGAFQQFNAVDGEQASWLYDVAVKFKTPVVWWVRDTPDVPWRIVRRWGVKADLIAQQAEWRPKGADPSGNTGPLKPAR